MGNMKVIIGVLQGQRKRNGNYYDRVTLGCTGFILLILKILHDLNMK